MLESLLRAAALGLLLLGCLAGPLRADEPGGDDPPRIYKWVDSNGIAHYTTDPSRIPKALRNRFRSVERGLARSAPPAAEPEPPAVAPTPEIPQTASTPAPLPDATSPDPTDPATKESTGPAAGGTSPSPSAANEGVPPSAANEGVPPSAAREEAPPSAASAATQPAPTVVSPAAATPEPLPAPTPALPPDPPTAIRTPVPASKLSAAPPRAAVPTFDDAWAMRDAPPRIAPGDAGSADGPPTPEMLEARAVEREALDAEIAEVEQALARDEDALKELISDPALDAADPLFDRPDFLEVSQRLPQLQAQLAELRERRAELEIR